jgi:acyl carrier protein
VDLEEHVTTLMHECAAMADVTLCHPITRDLVLLESGLDSLGFATLVARLEEELGYDPFSMTDEVLYPHTFGEFVDIYRDAATKLGR